SLMAFGHERTQKAHHPIGVYQKVRRHHEREYEPDEAFDDLGKKSSSDPEEFFHFALGGARRATEKVSQASAWFVPVRARTYDVAAFSSGGQLKFELLQADLVLPGFFLDDL